MKDSQLYLVVGMLISIDIITMTLWQVMDPFYRQTKELEAYVSCLALLKHYFLFHLFKRTYIIFFCPFYILFYALFMPFFGNVLSKDGMSLLSE